MKTKTVKMLPQTAGEISNGGIYAQSRKCGKNNCKCARGEKHRGYFFFTRRNGKLTKTYIRKSQVQSFSRLVEIATADRKQRRRTTIANLELLREFREFLREKQSFINSLKGI